MSIRLVSGRIGFHFRTRPQGAIAEMATPFEALENRARDIHWLRTWRRLIRPGRRNGRRFRVAHR